MQELYIPQIKEDNFEEIPSIRNFFLFVLCCFHQIYFLFIYPLYLNHNFSLLMLIFLFVLIIPIQGSLFHEAMHGMMMKNRFINALYGKILCTFFGVSYEKLLIEHVIHHENNRKENYCDEVYTKKQGTKLKIYLTYYYKQVVGVYLKEFFFFLIICFMPKQSIVNIMGWYKNQKNATYILDNIWNVRTQAIIHILMLSISFYLYSENLYWVLPAMIFFKGVVFAVSGALGHFGTPLNDVYYAHNIKLPYLIGKYYFLNFNYHGIHHRYPTLPWIHLGNKMNELGKNSALGKFHVSFIKAVIKKFYLPIILESFSKKVVLLNNAEYD